jgi:hypothetical protein
MIALLFIFALGCLMGHSVRGMDFTKGAFLPAVFGLAAITLWCSPDIVGERLMDRYLWAGHNEPLHGEPRSALWYWDGKSHMLVIQSPDGQLRTVKGRIPDRTRYFSYPDGPPDGDIENEGSGRGWPYQ